jgi:hypothetical protein
LLLPLLPVAAPGRLNLAPLWATAAQQYVHLLTLVPEVLESYQSTDASGGTVRRWAVLSDQTTVHIDASVHPSASSAAAAAAAATAGGSAKQQPQQAATAAAQAAAPPLPRGVQQELDFLQKRHGLRQLPPGQAAADAVAGQLAGLRLAGGGAQTAPPAAPAATEGAAAAALEVPMVVFELRVQPTDPAWDSSHPLLLAGSLAGGYPQAAGSLVLTVSPQQPQPLPELQRQVLDKLLAAEVASATGRPGALRSLVRYVENHGGELWQQAEDIAAEVGRRRQAQAQQQQEQQRAGVVPAASSSSGRQQRQLRGADRAHSSSSSSSSGNSGSELDDDGAGGGYHSSGSSGDYVYASSSSGTGSDAEVLSEGPGGQGAGGGGGHSDAVLPLQLQLEGLELIECDALEVLRLNLQLTCARCRAAGELSFATAAVALPSDAAGARARRGVLSAAAECATCHSPWAVEVAPKLVHDFNSVLAHVRAEGCTPLDLLPSMLAGQCSHCAASAAFRSVVIGRWNDRACSSCHAAMRFQFSAARFVPHTPASRQQHGGGGGAAGRQQQQQQPGASTAAAIGPHGPLQLGQPLPDKGTCKHYRWVLSVLPRPG